MTSLEICRLVEAACHYTTLHLDSTGSRKLPLEPRRLNCLDQSLPCLTQDCGYSCWRRTFDGLETLSCSVRVVANASTDGSAFLEHLLIWFLRWSHFSVHQCSVNGYAARSFPCGGWQRIESGGRSYSWRQTFDFLGLIVVLIRLDCVMRTHRSARVGPEFSRYFDCAFSRLVLL